MNGYIGQLRNMTALYLTSGDDIFLLYRQGSRIVGDCYTGTAGGHFEPGEINDPKACALRELYEETGLAETDIRGLSLRYITIRLKNGEIRQNYYFFAELIDDKKELLSNEGLIRRFKLNEIPELEMPLSAKNVIEHYLREGRNTDLIYGGVTEKSGTDFTALKEF